MKIIQIAKEWAAAVAEWANARFKRRPVYVVDAPSSRALSVTHTVMATIFRAPVFAIEDKRRGKYYTSKRVYVPGIIRETVFAAPGAEDMGVAHAMVAEKVGFRTAWTEIVSKPRILAKDVDVLPGDVVQYLETLT